MNVPIQPTNPPESQEPSTPAGRRTGTSCALVFVGVLVILVVLLGAMIAVTAHKIPRFFSKAKSLAVCQMHLQDSNSESDIAGALARYAKWNHKYPDKLTDLYPTFLNSKSLLHCPADPRPENVVSYEYMKPDINAPGDTVVVVCRHHVMMPDQPPWVLKLLKNGSVVREMPNPADSRSKK
jgi:hypothetical protein